MTATILPREYGVKLTCNRCGETVQTAMCGRGANRKWFAKLGWGRGSDPGSDYRASEPARAAERNASGKVIKRARPAKAEIEGRPRTTAHDLCPPCLKLDRQAMAERKARRAAQLKARDAKRKERDAMLRHTAAQAEADAR